MPGVDRLDAGSILDPFGAARVELERLADPSDIPEQDRAARLAEAWEREVSHTLMRGPLNMVQLTLACALALELRMPDLDWRSGHPKLRDWYAPLAARASFKATEPPRP